MSSYIHCIIFSWKVINGDMTLKVVINLSFSARYQFPGLTWCNGFPIVCSTNLRMPLMLWVLTESLNHLKWFVLSCLVQECALYVMFPLIKNTYIPSWVFFSKKGWYFITILFYYWDRCCRMNLLSFHVFHVHT